MSRRNKTDALSGLLQEANPKHGGDCWGDDHINKQIIFASKLSLSHFNYPPGSDSPASRQLNTKKKLCKLALSNEISKPPSVKGWADAIRQMLFLAYCKRPTQSTAATVEATITSISKSFSQASSRYLISTIHQEAIPSLASSKELAPWHALIFRQ